MDQSYLRYKEDFLEDFSIQHKITEHTEKKNFHLHKQLEIIFALSGNLKCKFESGIAPIPENGLILLNPMNLHYIYSEPGSGDCDRFVLYFFSNYISYLSTPEVNLLECFFSSQGGRPVILTVPKDSLKRFIFLLEQMERCHQKKELYGNELHTKFLLGQFLLLTNQLYFQQYGYRSSPAFQSHSQLVSRICEYIGDVFDSHLTVESIAHRFCISKTQLYCIFKEVTGLTVSEYITEYRITKAKDFLINTHWSIEIISQAAGYMNLSSFSRVFKLKTGHSPMEYRKIFNSPSGQTAKNGTA